MSPPKLCWWQRRQAWAVGVVTDRAAAQGAVLAPAVAAVCVGDHLLAVHVVGGGVADQAVDGVLFALPGAVQGHHLAQGRLVLAADVALAAAFAEGVAGLGDHQFGPGGHGEGAGLGAGAVDLAHGEVVGQFAVEAVDVGVRRW